LETGHQGKGVNIKSLRRLDGRGGFRKKVDWVFKEKSKGLKRKSGKHSPILKRDTEAGGSYGQRSGLVGKTDDKKRMKDSNHN